VEIHNRGGKNTCDNWCEWEKAHRKQIPARHTQGEENIYVHSFSNPTLSSTLAINLKQSAQSVTVTWKQAWS